MTTRAVKKPATEIAAEIVSKAKTLGWTLKLRGSVLTITKRIASRDDFVTADGEYYDILGRLPMTSPGSTWGTDGGGIGALSAMKSGLFIMNKSGGSVRVLKAIEKMVA